MLTPLPPVNLGQVADLPDRFIQETDDEILIGSGVTSAVISSDGGEARATMPVFLDVGDPFLLPLAFVFVRGGILMRRAGPSFACR